MSGSITCVATSCVAGRVTAADTNTPVMGGSAPLLLPTRPQSPAHIEAAVGHALVVCSLCGHTSDLAYVTCSQQITNQGQPMNQPPPVMRLQLGDAALPKETCRCCVQQAGW